MTSDSDAAAAAVAAAAAARVPSKRKRSRRGKTRLRTSRGRRGGNDAETAARLDASLAVLETAGSHQGETTAVAVPAGVASAVTAGSAGRRRAAVPSSKKHQHRHVHHRGDAYKVWFLNQSSGFVDIFWLKRKARLQCWGGSLVGGGRH